SFMALDTLTVPAGFSSSNLCATPSTYCLLGLSVNRWKNDISISPSSEVDSVPDEHPIITTRDSNTIIIDKPFFTKFIFLLLHGLIIYQRNICFILLIIN